MSVDAAKFRQPIRVSNIRNKNSLLTSNRNVEFGVSTNDTADFHDLCSTDSSPVNFAAPKKRFDDFKLPLLPQFGQHRYQN